MLLDLDYLVNVGADFSFLKNEVHLVPEKFDALLERVYLECQHLGRACDHFCIFLKLFVFRGYIQLEEDSVCKVIDGVKLAQHFGHLEHTKVKEAILAFTL